MGWGETKLWSAIGDSTAAMVLDLSDPDAAAQLVARSLPDPSMAPAELEMITLEQCAEIALKGMDLDLFYIPTKAHLLDDMQPRVRDIEASLNALGIEKTF